MKENIEELSQPPTPAAASTPPVAPTPPNRALPVMQQHIATHRNYCTQLRKFHFHVPIWIYLAIYQQKTTAKRPDEK